MKEIDLGQDLKKCCEATPASDSGGKYYPQLHISGEQKFDFPDSGKLLVEFRKVSSSEHKSGESPARYDCTLEVRKILKMDGQENEMPAKMDRGAEEALDRLAEALSQRKNRNSERNEGEEEGEGEYED